MATEYEFIMVLDDGETYSSLKGCKVLMVPKEEMDNLDLKDHGILYDKVAEFSNRFVHIDKHAGMVLDHQSGSISARLPNRFTSD